MQVIRGMDIYPKCLSVDYSVKLANSFSMLQEKKIIPRGENSFPAKSAHAYEKLKVYSSVLLREMFVSAYRTSCFQLYFWVQIIKS
jgi:hypothetical protein